MNKCLISMLLMFLAAGCSDNVRQGVERPVTPDKADLVFEGTVEKIEISPLKRSLDNWIVTFQVNKVLSGDFKGKRFSFRIHSPIRSGLKV